MRVGVVGAGEIGRHVGRLFAKAGHEVCLSWSSTPERLREACEAVGYGTMSASPAQAVAAAGVVLFAPRFEHLGLAADAVGCFGGVAVIDATNPSNPERDGLVELGGRTAAQTVRDRLVAASYVKGFNTLSAEFLTAAAGRAGNERVVLFLSGDDQVAKALVAGLAHEVGFAPVDVGDCAHSVAQEPGGRYYGEEFHLGDVAALVHL